MKTLTIPLLLMTSLAFADVSIVPPTQYDNGDSLPIEDIDHYDICIASTSEDICDSVIIVVGETIDSALIPTGTHHIKARTVTVFGEVGIYGAERTGLNRRPTATEIEFKRVTTTNSVVTTTVVTTE